MLIDDDYQYLFEEPIADICHYRHRRRWCPFFNMVPFFAQRTRNLGLFCCEFTHFLVFFYRAIVSQNWQLSDVEDPPNAICRNIWDFVPNQPRPAVVARTTKPTKMFALFNILKTLTHRKKTALCNNCNINIPICYAQTPLEIWRFAVVATQKWFQVLETPDSSCSECWFYVGCCAKY